MPKRPSLAELLKESERLREQSRQIQKDADALGKQVKKAIDAAAQTLRKTDRVTRGP